MSKILILSLREIDNNNIMKSIDSMIDLNDIDIVVEETKINPINLTLSNMNRELGGSLPKFITDNIKI
jgi:hypothetical protein